MKCIINRKTEDLPTLALSWNSPADNEKLSMDGVMNDEEKEPLGRDLAAVVKSELNHNRQVMKYMQELTTPFQIVLSQAHQIGTEVNAWFERSHTFFRELDQYFRSWAAVLQQAVNNADLASQYFIAELMKMNTIAGYGWTLPTYLSPEEFVQFVNTAVTKEAAGNFLIEKLETSDPELRNMEAWLLRHNPRLKGFSTVLPQCFRAIRNRDYAITVPNLFAILDRTILDLDKEALL